MSIYSLWVMIDRFVVFMRAKKYSLSFVLGLREKMAKRDLNGALNLSKQEPQSPIAKVISRGARRVQRRPRRHRQDRSRRGR